MKVKLIIISIILLLVIVFASGCIPIMEKLGLVSPTDEEQLSPEKGGPPDGLVKVLIGFKEKPGAAQQAMVRGLGGKIKYTYHIVDAIAASIPEKAIDALQKNPNITHVELDSKVYALDTELDDSWGVKRIGAGLVHDSGNNGDGIKIAIIDTGIDHNHGDLTVAGGKSFVDYTDVFDDDDGHGTHVAGIVAALDNGIGVIGVAPGANLYALKVLNEKGVGDFSDIIAAIDWCVAEGIQVTNNSYGSSGDPGKIVKAAFDNSAEVGVLHVAAAGNSGNPPGRGDNVEYPAAYDSVIAVAATDQNDKRARWSSTGPAVELAAPGVGIYSTYIGGYATYSGTSMAAPHVAGTAALVIVAGISDVRGQLQSTADDLGDPEKYGYGLVNAAEAASEPVDVHDVAVTAISAPSWVLQGDMVNVYMDVANEGTFEETFDVVLTESPDGFSDTKKITLTLVVGASTTVSFPWQTSESTTLGDHTLTATAGPVTNETDIADNSKSTIVTVEEAVANIMYVKSIVFSSKVAGPNKFLYITVKVVDGDGFALEGVGVEMTLNYDKENDGTIEKSRDFAGDTASNGTVKFTLNKASSGYYTATVTNLILTEDYGWDTTKGITEASCELKDNGTVVLPES